MKATDASRYTIPDFDGMLGKIIIDIVRTNPHSVHKAPTPTGLCAHSQTGPGHALDALASSGSSVLEIGLQTLSQAAIQPVIMQQETLESNSPSSGIPTMAHNTSNILRSLLSADLKRRSLKWRSPEARCLQVSSEGSANFSVPPAFENHLALDPE